MRGQLYFSMNQKFFPADKNYILKEAQEASRESLIQWLFEELKARYLLHFNPLGLEDELTIKIRACEMAGLSVCNVFYQKLAIIYRYRFGSNQLEFMFDGKSHLERYQEEWFKIFKVWTLELFEDAQLVKIWMHGLIFHSDDPFKIESVSGRVRSVIERHFSMKLDKRKGLLIV